MQQQQLPGVACVGSSVDETGEVVDSSIGRCLRCVWVQFSVSLWARIMADTPDHGQIWGINKYDARFQASPTLCAVVQCDASPVVVG
jgi:hypothetical protein